MEKKKAKYNNPDLLFDLVDCLLLFVAFFCFSLSSIKTTVATGPFFLYSLDQTLKVTSLPYYMISLHPAISWKVPRQAQTYTKIFAKCFRLRIIIFEYNRTDLCPALPFIFIFLFPSLSLACTLTFYVTTLLWSSNKF